MHTFISYHTIHYHTMERDIEALHIYGLSQSIPLVSHSTFCKCILLSTSISISHHTIEGDIEALHMASHHRCLLAAIAPPAAVNAIHANFYQFSPYYTYHIQYHTPFHISLIKVCNVCKSLEVHNLGSLACICSAGRCPSCS